MVGWISTAAVDVEDSNAICRLVELVSMLNCDVDSGFGDELVSTLDGCDVELDALVDELDELDVELLVDELDELDVELVSVAKSLGDVSRSACVGAAGVDLVLWW